MKELEIVWTVKNEYGNIINQWKDKIVNNNREVKLNSLWPIIKDKNQDNILDAICVQKEDREIL